MSFCNLIPEQNKNIKVKSSGRNSVNKSDKDSLCMKVTETPIHTHKKRPNASRKSRSGRSKTRVSHKKKNVKRKLNKPKLVKKFSCAGKQLSAKRPEKLKRRKTVKASSIKPRGLGCQKIKLSSKRKIHITIKKKRSNKKTKPIHGRCPKIFVNDLHSKTKHKSFRSYETKKKRKPKQILSVKKCKLQKKLSKVTRKRKSQKLRVKIHRKKPRLHSTKNVHSPVCKKRSSSVSSIWLSRLRPRPLKTARFVCYRPVCLARLSQKVIPSNKIQTKTNSKSKSFSKCNVTNSSNKLFIVNDISNNIEQDQWYDAHECMNFVGNLCEECNSCLESHNSENQIINLVESNMEFNNNGNDTTKSSVLENDGITI